MKALSKLATAALLLTTLAMLPSTVIAFRYMVDQMTVGAPHLASPIEEAEFWARAFGP